MRFLIKNTASKAEKEGDAFIRYSGTAEPFHRVSEREGQAVGTDSNGNVQLVFTTGLETNKIEFFKWYNEEEQKEVEKQIKELRPTILNFYGGEEVIKSTNKFFWQDDRRVNRLSLQNTDIDQFYDTKNASHALLYLSIISGAFIDMVGPTRDWAERHQLPHYLALETEDTFEEEDEITRSDAHAALAELRKDANPESLFILAWCIQYDTQSYGAYTKNIPTKDLINYHIKYIDGKLVSKKKRNTPKVFLEYAEKWKAQQTRPALYVEAYVKAGDYFNFISKKTKNYETEEGTALGNTIEEAVATLLKPKFNQEFQKLRDKVEAKWKE